MSNKPYIIPKVNKSKAILKKAFSRFNNIGIAFSGGTDSLVALSLTLPFNWNIPVLFVDTYNQFTKTYQFIHYINKTWELNLHIFRAEEDKHEYFRNKHGDSSVFYEKCCLYHKIKPLLEGIKELKLDALIVGIRGAEHPERAKESIFSPRKDHCRIHPVLFWTRQDIIDYALLYSLPTNPLYKEGYTSLGCMHCTKPNPDPSKHERSGRARLRELIMEKLRREGYT